MKSLARALSVLLLAGSVVALGTHRAQAADPPLLTMQTFTAATNQPVGVDAHYTNGAVDSLIVSVNHIDGGGGTPYNFVQVPLNGGSVIQFGPTAGLPDEISITTVKPGQPGGWTVGDMFVPGDAGTVKRLKTDGTLADFANVETHFSTDYIRGEMAFDRTGLFDNALISASRSGVISKIAATGASVTLANVGVEIEGVTVVPGDVKYGPWAGRVIASSPESGLVYAIAPDGTFTSTNLGIQTDRLSQYVASGINDWESVHVIPANADFYQVEYNHNSVLKLTAAQLAPYVGRILLVQEATPAQLWLIDWDPTAQAFTHTLLAAPRDPGDVSTNGNYNLEQGNFVPVLGSISGTLYCDLNKNKQLDSGEPGIPGQTVTLTGPVNATTTTDANGNYLFSNLPGGSYSIVAPTIADNKNLETTSPLSVNLPDGGNSTDNNFGYVLGSISGVVYCDLNKDLLLDNGEPGISGVTVTLLQNNMVIATTTTDANGFYQFTNLPSGTYTVSSPATADGKNLETQSPLTVVLPVGGDMPNNNFGYIAPVPQQTGPLYTATQGGWGAKPAGNNVAMFLKKNFATAFPSGVTIGTGTKTATFSSQLAIQNFLPAGGSFSPFTKSYTNPTSTPAGVFAGQVLSATLAVGFSNAGITNAGLGSVKPVSGPLAGLTINQILVEANKVLAGQASVYSESDLNTVLDLFNNNYDEGKVNKGGFQ